MDTTPASRSDRMSSTECSCSCSSVKLAASRAGSPGSPRSGSCHRGCGGAPKACGPLAPPAQPLAPLLFGAVFDYIFGGRTGGLRWTFVVMLLPLAAAAFFLFLARRYYRSDVAAAAVLTRRAALGASSPWRQLR